MELLCDIQVLLEHWSEYNQEVDGVALASGEIGSGFLS
jgi:hypothetical protein